MWSTFYAIGLIAVVVSMYLIINVANKATPKPEGCTLDISSCSSCSSEAGCGLR